MEGGRSLDAFKLRLVRLAWPDSGRGLGELHGVTMRDFSEVEVLLGEDAVCGGSATELKRDGLDSCTDLGCDGQPTHRDGSLPAPGAWSPALDWAAVR